MKSAILVDGSFFIKRYRVLYPDWRNRLPNQVARDLYAGVVKSLRSACKNSTKREIYRIFYYDCPPITKRLENPITKKGINMGSTPEAIFRTAFHEELKKFRKVALRLGRIADDGSWVIKTDITKKLLNGSIQISDLQETDVKYEARQKGVDMRIGIDIASLSYKKAIDQIILIAGDSDFVPAAKLARREGIDFVLNPMWNNINQDLHEHIDGLCSGWDKPTAEAP